MKKIKFLWMFAGLALSFSLWSCSSEQDAVVYSNSELATNQSSFRNAFREYSKARSGKSFADADADLNTAMAESSIAFLVSNGISIEAIQAKTGGDNPKIISMAFDEFIKKQARESKTN